MLAVCEVFGMSLWFSAAAVLPALKAQYSIDGFQAAALSSSVALGFVLGTLTSAVLGLADRIEPRRFFAGAAIIGALANGLTIFIAPTSLICVLLRAIVGASIAGIYPVGIKMAATWARADLGLLVGLLVAAATLGSATSFLLAAFGGFDWRLALLGASALSLSAALLIQVFDYGPLHTRATQFRARYVLDAWTERPLRLANLGYYGHMWELYAMWAWIAAFIEASFLQSARLTFGAVLGQDCSLRLDRARRLRLPCRRRAGRPFRAHHAHHRRHAVKRKLRGAGGIPVRQPALAAGGVLHRLGQRGRSPNSAQFSASVVELAKPERVGTMITVQTCIGFLLTMVSIHLVPPINAAVGWRWTFLFLAAGPFLGAWAMLALRRDPAAKRLAGGKR